MQLDIKQAIKSFWSDLDQQVNIHRDVPRSSWTEWKAWLLQSLESTLLRSTCRVDGVLLSGQQHGMSLADMASAAVTGQQESSLGTAVYLLASLFNHSCTPNVDVTFPANNSKHCSLTSLVPIPHLDHV